MKLSSIAVAVLAMMMLAGCATPYQEMGLLGGVSATQITKDTFQITARGNGYTDADTVERYALRKSAETTLASGFDLFLIGGDKNRSTSMRMSSGYAYGGYNWASGWGFSQELLKPGQTLMVKMFRGELPDPAPPGMFDARDVLSHLAPGAVIPARTQASATTTPQAAPQTGALEAQVPATPAAHPITPVSAPPEAARQFPGRSEPAARPAAVPAAPVKKCNTGIRVVGDPDALKCF